MTVGQIRTKRRTTSDKLPTSRQRISIGFKATPHADDDIIAWWQTMSAGERSQTLRTALRAAMVATVPGDGHLTAIAEHTTWICQALSDLPGYLEKVITRVASTRVVITERSSVTEPPPQSQLDGQSLDRRRGRIDAVAW